MPPSPVIDIPMIISVSAGSVLDLSLPPIKLGRSCIPCCLEQELVAGHLMLDARNARCKENLVAGTEELYARCNAALAAGPIEQILRSIQVQLGEPGVSSAFLCSGRCYSWA